jgi:hypothetical protein
VLIASTSRTARITSDFFLIFVLGLSDELDELDYMWEEMRGYLEPPPRRDRRRLRRRGTDGGRTIIAYGPGVFHGRAQDRALALLARRWQYAQRQQRGRLPSLVGFDWGRCAWRHCGAKADAQEAIAELYSNVGMPEPFECRFIIGENVSTLKRNSCGDCKWTFVRGTSSFFFSNDKLIVAHAHHL